MLLERAAGNLEYVKEMIELFCQEMPGYLTEMDEALSKDDQETVKRLAHKMYSPAALFGAANLCSALREMETKADLSTEDLKELVQRVNQKCQSAFEELKKELTKIDLLFTDNLNGNH